MSLLFLPPTPCVPHPPPRIPRPRNLCTSKLTPPRTQTPATPPSPGNPSPPLLPLRRPSTVATAPAAAFRLVLSHLFSAWTLTFPRLRARTLHHGSLRRAAARLGARREQQRFLQSAVAATSATLSTTRVYLRAQRARAEAAEGRLREYEVRWAEVEKVGREVRRRRRELVQVETDLGEVGREVKGGVIRLEEVRGKVREWERRGEEVERERTRLQGDREREEKVVRECGGEVGRLEAMLMKAKGRLERELLERDMFGEQLKKGERKLEEARGVFEVAVSDLEERRERIQQVSEEVREVGTGSARKRAGLEKVVRGEVAVKEVEAAVGRIREEREAVRAALEGVREREREEANEKRRLASRLCEKEEEVRELRKRVEATKREGIEVKLEVRRGCKDDDNVGAVMEQGAGAEDTVDLADSDVVDGVTLGRKDGQDVEIAVENSEQGVVRGQVDKQNTVGDSQGADTVSATLHLGSAEGACSSETNSNEPPRRRGRPRKSEQRSTSSESVSQPKRSRGRPKKVPIVSAVSVDTQFKRKRGRPRKTTAAANSTMSPTSDS